MSEPIEELIAELRESIRQILTETCRGEIHAATAGILDLFTPALSDLQARVAELEGALKPFAEAWLARKDGIAATTNAYRYAGAINAMRALATREDFQRAAAALSPVLRGLGEGSVTAHPSRTAQEPPTPDAEPSCPEEGA